MLRQESFTRTKRARDLTSGEQVEWGEEGGKRGALARGINR